MKRTATAATWTVAAMMLAAAASGCSSGGNSSSSASPSAPSSASGGGYGGGSSAPSSGVATAQATVATRSVSRLGTILVDQKGLTLYLFVADTSTKSTCSGTCAAAWPPLLTSGNAKAGKGAKSNLLGTTKRSDGSSEVTYNGHPLYYYAGDSKPGDTNGQGLNQFGALWWVLDADGKQVTTR